MSYINRYGLINATKHEDVSENCPLFTLQNVILKKIVKEDPKELEDSLINYFEKMRNPTTNRFNNIPDVTSGRDALISHDQFTTLCAMSARHGLDYHKEFWNGVKWGTYDNLTGKFNIHRILHPRDLIYVGYLNDNFLCKLAMPLLCAATLWSFLYPYKKRNGVKILKTDGQLLTLVRKYGLKGKSWLFDKTWKLCERISHWKFVDGYKGIFKTYYPLEDHPNHILANRINNYNLD